MRTFKRICLRDFTVVDELGHTCTIKRGMEYITSEVNAAPAFGPEPLRDHVVVFTNYWIHVPVEIFGGAVRFTG